MQQLLLDIKPLPSPTLVNFLPGHNTELLQMLTNILSQQEKEHPSGNIATRSPHTW